MNFDRFFKLISYAVVFCGFFSLFVSGGVGIVSTVLFVSVLLVAWFLEDSGWQISERLGTVLVFVVVPLFYVAGKYQFFGFGTSASELAATLARMILVLAALKLLQRKGDRDWLFLYLMAFFEVLLAAGLSISPLYLASLILYLLVTICAIVTFEVRKTSAAIAKNSSYKAESKEKTFFVKIPLSRLSLTATALLVLIVVFAAPLFFALPRVGGAGLGSQRGLSNITGFSDSVNLGEVGSLLQNDQIVMRARIDKTDGRNSDALKWRGVALDSFDNRRWSKSNKTFRESFVKLEHGYFLIDYPQPNAASTIQMIYLEPIDTPVLFALSRPLAVEGSFQSELYKDSEGAITFQRGGSERISYKINSDRSLPAVSRLKSDDEDYAPEAERYLQLPKIDDRISILAAQIAAKQTNRYDKAKAVEDYLQTEFGYTLEMKAKGNEPLADFLFNVREGHCEYFATAMAIMLRTQGIATRIVNGFQQGEYNETADVFVVKQKDAHSWVEVYFPGENAWVPFDPTPAAGRFDDSTQAGGILGKFNGYLVALETFWIQYFVAYDNQEQRSLMRSVKNSFVEYQAKTSVWLNEMQYKLSDWWTEVRGDKGLQASARAVAFAVLYLLAAVAGIILIVWLYRKIKRLNVWQRIYTWLKSRNERSIVEFYERMQKILASKGFTRHAHQTPLEFAFALNMPEAVSITEKYNRVRFGEKNLSRDETREIENWLKNLESKQ